MSWSRFSAVFKEDFFHNLKRPFFWTWVAVLLLNAWLISNSAWIIRSVDTSVGTEKSFVNSEFQLAFVFSLMCFLILGFFAAIAAGTPVLRDSQYRIGEIIHATPLKPSEYVLGKYFASLVTALVAILLFVLALILLNDVIPNPAAAQFHGPFRLRNYVMPVFVFMMPAVLFITSISLAISVFSKRPFLVYLFPVAMMLIAFNFLYSWYPQNASPTQTYFVQLLDPAGFRWLKQTWLVVDRGVTYYNANPIQYDAGFLAGRFLYPALAIAALWVSTRHFGRKFARVPNQRTKKLQEAATIPAAPASYARIDAMPDVSRKGISALRQILSVARFESIESLSQPWLLVVIVIVAIVLLAPDRGALGELHVLTRYTSGLMAVNTMTPLTVMLCFLLMFTTAESLHREASTGLAPLYYSTPSLTGAVVIGKTLANFFIGVIAMIVSFIFLATFLLMQHEAPFELKPFLYTWILLVLPTLFFWCAFIAAAYSITKSRTASYAIGIAFLFISGWALFSQKVNWVTNWSLFQSLVWTDFGIFELDRKALVLNRLFYFSIAIVLLVSAIYYFPRRLRDANFKRFKTRAFVLKVIVLIAVPAALGITLWLKVENGFQGTKAEILEKEYWQKNVASFWNVPLPDRSFIDLDLKLEPAQRSFHVNGSYEFINLQNIPLYRIPLTGVGYWTNLKWTLNGAPYKPEDRSKLFVFTFDPPLQPQQKVTIGFSYDGKMLPGISKNGGPLQLGEFILDSGVALTGRNPWFVPVLGFVETIGVDEKNQYEPRDPGPKYYEGITDAGIDRSLLNTRIRINVPEDFMATSMGVLKSDEHRNGRRILLWESDYPVRVFNVVAGRWISKDGEASRIYYLPKHPYNIDSMLGALDGSRKYYSEWFGPYVWKELRMNEFPALALYARGNPTNIFFSEGIGFLTKDHMQTDIFFGLSAFAVTAHEAAHQWWGHMMSPGNGPGGIVLAEGMASFSTLCLLEKMKGNAHRQALSQFMEQFYGENRFVTTERPLSKTSQGRAADTTVVYDKGAWVFWMMRNLMGHDAMYKGLQSFITKYHRGPDHPVIEDFVAHMRSFSTDVSAYDEFVKQWFFEVSIPEYKFLEKPKKTAVQNGWEVRALLKNFGTAKMPVEVAVLRGDDAKDKKGFNKSSMTVTLGAGESKELLIQSNFEPDRIVVDPDIQVLQLQRRAASIRF